MNIIKVKKVNNEFGDFSNIYLVNDFLNVPLVEGNRHYQEILKWVAEGNTIEESD